MEPNRTFVPKFSVFAAGLKNFKKKEILIPTLNCNNFETLSQAGHIAVYMLSGPAHNQKLVTTRITVAHFTIYKEKRIFRGEENL